MLWRQKRILVFLKFSKPGKGFVTYKVLQQWLLVEWVNEWLRYSNILINLISYTPLNGPSYIEKLLSTKHTLHCPTSGLLFILFFLSRVYLFSIFSSSIALKQMIFLSFNHYSTNLACVYYYASYVFWLGACILCISGCHVACCLWILYSTFTMLCK